MKAKNQIGPMVRQIRLHKGWTQAQLAKRLQGLGWPCSADHISKIERRLTPVWDFQFVVLAHVLEVGYEELFPPGLLRDSGRDMK